MSLQFLHYSEINGVDCKAIDFMLLMSQYDTIIDVNMSSITL